MNTRLLIGTTKGAFILNSDDDRQTWSVSGPHCEGWGINHVVGDDKTGEIWAAGGSAWSGAGVWCSTDGGQNWVLSKLGGGQIDEELRNNPDMAAYMGNPEIIDAPFTGEVEAMWTIARSNGALYAGGKPGMLFRSADSGANWERVDSICDHPDRKSWMPGGAGLTLHTIVCDPNDPAKLWIGMSAVGVFASEDGGKSWELRNRRSNAPAGEVHTHADGTVHDTGGEVGSCVHNVVRAANMPGDLLYQQNHHGTFRSADGGRSWADITNGLPSNFGFPISVHPHDPQTIWVIPMNGDMQGRYPPDAVAKVWKSSNGGETWEAKTAGLPGKNCFFTVLRQAMATDDRPAPGVYFGTNSGTIFGSLDGGESWQDIASHLPTVLSVETMAC